MEEMNRRNDQGLGLPVKYIMMFLFCTELFYKKRKSRHLNAGFVRCHPDSNRRIKVLQTFALPLGYGTNKNGAVDGTRTRDIHLGKVALYQLSYYRMGNRGNCADEETRTLTPFDTRS